MFLCNVPFISSCYREDVLLIPLKVFFPINHSHAYSTEKKEWNSRNNWERKTGSKTPRVWLFLIRNVSPSSQLFQTLLFRSVKPWPSSTHLPLFSCTTYLKMCALEVHVKEKQKWFFLLFRRNVGTSQPHHHHIHTWNEKGSKRNLF